MASFPQLMPRVPMATSANPTVAPTMECVADTGMRRSVAAISHTHEPATQTLKYSVEFHLWSARGKRSVFSVSVSCVRIRCEAGPRLGFSPIPHAHTNTNKQTHTDTDRQTDRHTHIFSVSVVQLSDTAGEHRWVARTYCNCSPVQTQTDLASLPTHHLAPWGISETSICRLARRISTTPSVLGPELLRLFPSHLPTNEQQINEI